MVERAEREGHLAADGRDVDDHPVPVGAEMRQQGLGDLQEADDVSVELAPDLVHRKRFQGAVGAVAGVVHQHVDPAEPADAGIHGGGDGRGIGHVQPRHQHVVEMGQVLVLFRRAHGGDHVPALFLEQGGSGLADAARRAGDEDRLAHVVPSSVGRAAGSPCGSPRTIPALAPEQCDGSGDRASPRGTAGTAWLAYPQCTGSAGGFTRRARQTTCRPRQSPDAPQRRLVRRDGRSG